MLRVIEVAEYFLWRACQEDNELISNLKLQKLLYYAQGYCLARLGRPLFDAPIEAWEHGPVVSEVYRTYKQYGKSALPCPPNFRVEKFRSQEQFVVDEVYAIFSPFSAWKLREMTHSEPLWQKTKNGDVIGVTQLKEFFLTKVQYRPTIVQTEMRSWDEIAQDLFEEQHELWEKLARV